MRDNVHPRYAALLAATHCYVGICPDCGEEYAATVDVQGDKADQRRTAKFVAELVRDGLEVKRIPRKDVRLACECYKKPKAEPQPSLSETADVR